jgi:hypothetical protein
MKYLARKRYTCLGQTTIFKKSHSAWSGAPRPIWTEITLGVSSTPVKDGGRRVRLRVHRESRAEAGYVSRRRTFSTAPQAIWRTSLTAARTDAYVCISHTVKKFLSRCLSSGRKSSFVSPFRVILTPRSDTISDAFTAFSRTGGQCHRLYRIRRSDSKLPLADPRNSGVGCRTRALAVFV